MRLGAGLGLATPDSNRWQVVVADAAATGVAMRLNDDANRVSLGLAFLEGRKIVDVSSDPTSWMRCLRDEAYARRQPRRRWADAIGHGLTRFAVDRHWMDQPTAPLAPELVAAAAAWPLLRPAIAAGADERVVPRWATALLSASDLSTGTRALLGRRADRRVIRAIATALSGPVRWWPIACAVAIGGLDAGRVGDLLESSTGSHRCSDDDLRLLTRALGEAEPAVVRQLLQSVEDAADAPRFLRALDGWQRAGGRARDLPNRLDRLEAAIHARLDVPPARPIRPEPAPVQPPQQRRPRPPSVVEEPPDPLARWRHLHRARRGELELFVPRQPEDLTRWGTALGNCLGGYVPAVNAGRTVIVGIRHDQRLIGAAEIDPVNATIRQLEGRANRPLSDALLPDVIRLLADHGVHPE